MSHYVASHPEGAGAILAMKSALTSAQINADQVGYVNAHGTSTPAGDIAESRAIESVFGGASLFG